MTVYYVSQAATSSDANAGTSAGAAWATFGKALGAAGIASGDTVYIGPGIYREASVTVGFTPSATTNVIGDVDGSHTGVPGGEVRLTGLAVTDLAQANTALISQATKNFLAWSNIVFVGSGSGILTNMGGHDWSYTDCAFISPMAGVLALTATVDVASNATFNRCDFVQATVNTITLPTSTTADYDANILFQNCRFITSGSPTVVNVTASGANSFKGGGVHFRNCTWFGGATAVATGSANVSTTFPVTVKNCLTSLSGTTTLNANAAGQIVEDYNVFPNGGRVNVTAGTHSTVLPFVALLHFGQERIWGGQPRPFATPMQDSPWLTWGDAATSGNDVQLSVDNVNRARPGGGARVVKSGTFTSATVTTATDSGGGFGGGTRLQGAVVKITGGTGSGQVKMIKSHTNTVLTVFGNWQTTPDNTSTYTIYFGAPADSFTCSSGSTTTAVDSTASWTTNMWTGFAFTVTSGTGNGQSGTVTSNTSTALTVPTLGTGLDNTSKVKLYRQTDELTVNKAVGALERHETASKETTLTDAGSVAWRLFGWADQVLRIPVDTSSTTITVKVSFDTDHGNTNKPTAEIVADGEIGVTAETKTATGSAGSGTFETLTFAAQTPTATGYVTVILRAKADKPTGKAVFDTVSVS